MAMWFIAIFPAFWTFSCVPIWLYRYISSTWTLYVCLHEMQINFHAMAFVIVFFSLANLRQICFFFAVFLCDSIFSIAIWLFYQCIRSSHFFSVVVVAQSESERSKYGSSAIEDSFAPNKHDEGEKKAAKKLSKCLSTVLRTPRITCSK